MFQFVQARLIKHKLDGMQVIEDDIPLGTIFLIDIYSKKVAMLNYDDKQVIAHVVSIVDCEEWYPIVFECLELFV